MQFYSGEASASLEKAFIGGFVKISTDEDQIAAALMQYGPLSIGINAGPMQFYSGGVAHPWKILCNPQKLDHDGGLRHQHHPYWDRPGCRRGLRFVTVHLLWRLSLHRAHWRLQVAPPRAWQHAT